MPEELDSVQHVKPPPPAFFCQASPYSIIKQLGPVTFPGKREETGEEDWCIVCVANIKSCFPTAEVDAWEKYTITDIVLSHPEADSETPRRRNHSVISRNENSCRKQQNVHGDFKNVNNPGLRFFVFFVFAHRYLQAGLLLASGDVKALSSYSRFSDGPINPWITNFYPLHLTSASLPDPCICSESHVTQVNN